VHERFDSTRRAAVAALLLIVVGCGTRDSGRTPEGAGDAGSGRVTVHEAAPDTGSDPMIVALSDAFAARNPSARRVTIVEFRREGAGGGANLVLARGARPDAAYDGPADDELFGVFVFDDSLRRIRQTVTIFPSPRRGETRMRFDRTNAESVFVYGWASTSGETLMTAGFPWGGARAR
jgi:hypothetical protein